MFTKTPQRLSTDERRAQILDAAQALIAQQGIASLTAAQLARAVKLTPGALYKHFPSMDDMLAALAQRLVARLEETFPPDGAAPLDWLTTFVAQRQALVGATPGALSLLLSRQVVLALPPAGRRALSGAVSSTVARVTAVLRRGQQDGSIRADVAAEALVPFVLGLTQFLAARHAAGNRHPPPALAALRILLSPTPGRSHP